MLRRIHAQATAPATWYASHIAGCLVGYASRVNVDALGEALGKLAGDLAAYLPPAAFKARVQAELIRLGMTSAAVPQVPPPA